MISFVIPVKDEASSLPLLFKELLTVVKSLRLTYEIIFIDDGSSDRSGQILNSLSHKYPHVRVYSFRANFGKSAALEFAFSRAKGELIVTLDADLQDDPKDIVKLLALYKKEHFDFIVGWRHSRKDTWQKRLSSYFFNQGTKLLSQVNLHDYNCGLKLISTTVAKKLHLHGELHRFMPVLAAKLKYRIGEVRVTNRFRRYGKSKYGFERSLRGIIDLLTVLFLTHYENKPSHFFGIIGFLLTLIGLICNIYVTYIRVTTGTTGHHIPLLLGGVLLMLVGIQLISIGLIAELIVTTSKQEPDYL